MDGGAEQALGHKLQEARKKAGLTQQELCQRANLSYSTLAKIERGAIRAPSIFTIQSIAAALNTTLSDLMGDYSPVLSTEAPKKRSKSGVRFVYFDINGCLVRFFQQAFAKIAQDTGVRADLVESAFWHYNDDACRGEINMDEFNRLVAKRLGIDQIEWQNYYLESVDPIEEMHEELKWAMQHYHVGLLSNIMPGMIKQMLDRHLLPDVKYDVVIDSSEVGTIKPEAKIYEIAQSKAGVQPSEILLVDDDRTNLVAAEKMGWHVLWFDDYRPTESAQKVRDMLDPEE